MSDFTTTPRAFFPSSTFRASGLIAAFTFLICLFAAQSVQAQLTLTVTRTDNRNTTCVSGVDCSLREAVKAANAAATNDTINFAIPAGDAGCASGVCSITLRIFGALVVNDAATAGTLTITNSTGASNLLISANGGSRVFYLNAGANLAINGVTITRGRGTGNIFNLNGFGGGIYNNGGTTTLTNSTVSSNRAVNGGGITTDRGTLNLTSVTVTRNSSTSTTCTGCAGGILNLFGTANLKNTIVAVNTTANASAPPDFGGVVAAGSSFNLIGNGQRHDRHY